MGGELWLLGAQYLHPRRIATSHADAHGITASLMVLAEGHVLKSAACVVGPEVIVFVGLPASGVSSEPDVHGGGLPRRIRGLFKVSRLSTGSLVAQTPRPFYRQAQGWRLAEWQRVGSRGLTSSSARACRSF